MTSVADASEPMSADGPRWRVRTTRARGWRRLLAQPLAQADVRAPDGVRYYLRLSRRGHLGGSPLGPFDALLPAPVSLSVLLAANVYRRGHTVWTVDIVKAETAWRAERIIYSQRRRSVSGIVDLAVETAEAVQRGEKPWEDDAPMNWRLWIRKTMNWD
jgi:hypothetical protein